MQFKVKYLLILISFFLVACGQEVDLTFEIIYKSTQCKVIEPLNKIIESKQELNTYINFGWQAKQSAIEDINFDENIFLLVAAGERKNAGFYYDVLNNHAKFYKSDMKVQLPIRLNKPDAGSVQSQIIVSPCIVLSMKKINYQINLDDLYFVLQ